MFRKVLVALSAGLILSQQGAQAQYLSGAQAFGGNGKDGQIVKGNFTDSGIVQYNAVSVIVNSLALWTVNSGAQIYATNAVTINGTLSVATGCQGLPGGTNTGLDGLGIGHGNGAHSGHLSGGGGGAYAGNGGTGGGFNISSQGVFSGQGGSGYPISAQRGGSSGGTGSWDESGSLGLGGAAGAGGGFLTVAAYGPILVAAAGLIKADGGAGGNGSGASGNQSAGGGGSAGCAILASQTSITITPTHGVTANGGPGGIGFGAGIGGGGGGAGWIVNMAPVITMTGSTQTAGGSAGTPSGTPAAGAGTSGLTVNLVLTPSMPLLASVQHDNALFNLALIQKTLGRANHTVDGDVINLVGREAISYIAAESAQDSKDFDHICRELEGTQETTAIGDLVETVPCG